MGQNRLTLLFKYQIGFCKTTVKNLKLPTCRKWNNKMNLEYHVTKIVEQFKSQEIEDENFITVEHRENGITMWTAFIGKGENNNQKKSIKLSLSGGVFEIKRMAGNALLNAETY